MKQFEGFYKAIEQENFDKVKNIIDAGFDLNSYDEDGATFFSQQFYKEVLE